MTDRIDPRALAVGQRAAKHIGNPIEGDCIAQFAADAYAPTLAALEQARGALDTIAKRLEESAGGGRTLQSRKSLRESARAAIAIIDELEVE